MPKKERLTQNNQTRLLVKMQSTILLLMLPALAALVEGQEYYIIANEVSKHNIVSVVDIVAVCMKTDRLFS